MARLCRLQKSPLRHGTAVAELAVCLPVLALLTVASIDACAMIYTDNSLTIAAYEGVREGIRRESTSTGAIARCEEILAARHVRNATVTISPVDVGSAERGSPVTVSIVCPGSSNTVLSSGLYAGKSLQASCTMLKE